MSKKVVKKLALTLFLILISFIIVASEEFIDNVGDSSEDITDKVKGEINYKEIRSKEIIGFETVYKQVEYYFERCNYSNKTIMNEKVSCWNDTYYRQVIDDKKEGDPIYSYSPIEALEYDSKQYDFIGKGCSICETINYEVGKPRTGKLMLCSSDDDGYSAGLIECWVEDGSSYKIKDLVTGKIIESVGNFEVEIES